MNHVIKGVLVVATAIFVVGSIAACGHYRARHDPEQRAQALAERMAKELALTEPQQARLDVLKQEWLAAGKEMKARHEQLRSQVTALLEQPTLDRQRALNMVQEETRAVDTRAPQMVTAFGDFYDSLTPDQQQKIRERFKERIEHRHGYGHHDGRAW